MAKKIVVFLVYVFFVSVKIMAMELPADDKNEGSGIKNVLEVMLKEKESKNSEKNDAQCKLS